MKQDLGLVYVIKKHVVWLRQKTGYEIPVLSQFRVTENSIRLA
jgi:hypothetical protein